MSIKFFLIVPIEEAPTEPPKAAKFHPIEMAGFEKKPGLIYSHPIEHT